MGDSVSGVNDSARKRTVGDSVGRPGGGESKDGLNGYI